MIRLNVPHPPAAATTLIVSLGLVTRPAYLVILEAGVALLVVQAIIINRLDRCEYPLLGQRSGAEDRRAWPAEARCSGSTRLPLASVDARKNDWRDARPQQPNFAKSTGAR